MQEDLFPLPPEPEKKNVDAEKEGREPLISSVQPAIVEPFNIEDVSAINVEEPLTNTTTEKFIYPEISQEDNLTAGVDGEAQALDSEFTQIEGEYTEQLENPQEQLIPETVEDDDPLPPIKSVTEEELTEQVGQILTNQSMPLPQKVHALNYLMACLRLKNLAASITGKYGYAVQRGPFKGMILSRNDASINSYIPKLLGTYEQELHELFATVQGRNYSSVVIIGAEDGYYPSAFARLYSSSNVFTFSDNEQCRKSILDMAHINQLSSRIVVDTGPSRQQLASLMSQRTLVFMDSAANLADMPGSDLAEASELTDFIVECKSSVESRLISGMYQSTHKAMIINQSGRNPYEHESLGALNTLDAHQALWEQRKSQVEWLILADRGN